MSGSTGATDSVSPSREISTSVASQAVHRNGDGDRLAVGERGHEAHGHGTFAAGQRRDDAKPFGFPRVVDGAGSVVQLDRRPARGLGPRHERRRAERRTAEARSVVLNMRTSLRKKKTPPGPFDTRSRCTAQSNWIAGGLNRRLLIVL